MKRTGLLLILLLAIVLPSGAAMAARFDRIIGEGETVRGDITVVDDDLLIENGGVVNGDVTVFSGTATVNGKVTGDVSIFGGQLALDGQIEGDLVIFGGNLSLESNAVVDGSCVTLGGSLEDESDGVSCSSFGNRLGALDLSQIPIVPPVPPVPAPPQMPELDELPERPEAPAVPPIEVRPPSTASRIANFVMEASVVAGRSLVMGILALLVAAIFPVQLRQVGSAVRTRPTTSGAVGILTAVAAPSIMVLLLVVLAITCVGLLLYPAVFLLALALVAAVLIGWVAVGEIVGRKLLGWVGIKQSLPVSAALGTALLTLVLGTMGLFSFIWGEGLVFFILASVGLGAATLTQFGMKPYPPDGEPPVDPDKEEIVLNSMPS